MVVAVSTGAVAAFDDGQSAWAWFRPGRRGEPATRPRRGGRRAVAAGHRQLRGRPGGVCVGGAGRDLGRANEKQAAMLRGSRPPRRDRTADADRRLGLRPGSSRAPIGRGKALATAGDSCGRDAVRARSDSRAAERLRQALRTALRVQRDDRGGLHGGRSTGPTPDALIGAQRSPGLSRPYATDDPPLGEHIPSAPRR